MFKLKKFMDYKRFFTDFLLLWLIVEIILTKSLFNKGLPSGTDAMGYIAQTAYLAENNRWIYAWREFGLGAPGYLSGLDFTLIPATIILGDAVYAFKILTSLTFWLAGITMYAYVYHHTRKNNASILAAIIYMLNQWFYIQFTEGHLSIMFSYALVPLFFLTLDKAFKKPNPTNLIFLAFSLSILLVLFHPQITGICIFFGFIYLIIRLVGNVKQFTRVLLNSLIVTLPLFIGLTSIHLIPLILGVKPPYLTIYYRWPIEDTFVNINYFKDKIGFNESLIALIPLTIITLLSKRNRLTIFFLVSAYIAIFLTILPLLPFQELHQWIYLNIPLIEKVRAVKRWFFITVFSLSFLAGVNLAKVEGILKGKIKTVKHKVYILIVIILILILLINSVFVAKNYLNLTQTFTYPNDLNNLLYWLKNVPEDFRIAQSNYRCFGDSWMEPGIIGTGYHELVFDSYYIHGKMVFQDGGWSFPARNFYHFSKGLGELKHDKNLLKILGICNVKYVILPSYTPQKWKEIFISQEGSKVTLNYSNNLIIENKYCLPHFYVSDKYALVLGGRETLASIASFPNYTFNSCTLLFIHQNLDFLDNLLKNADTLIFCNSKLIDLSMLILSKTNKNYVIRLSKYAFPSINMSKFWVDSFFGRDHGKLTLSSSTVMTTGKNRLEILYNAEKEGWYEIWLKVLAHPHPGKLDIFIDKEYLLTIYEKQVKPDYKWTSCGLIYLKQGTHKITIINDGKGLNDLDMLVIAPPKIIEEATKKALQLLDNFKGRIMVIWEFEDLYSKEKTDLTDSGLKFLPYQASNGYAIEIPPLINIAPLGIANASSIQFCRDLGLLQPQYAIDNKMNTRWGSEFKKMPQWLTIEWENPQHIYGIKIFFEHAYAESYIIQTWDGEKWVDQVAITNNNNLTREHFFPEPVTTSKLRLYFTSAPAYQSVSIWELKVYAAKPIATKIEIPKNGKYKLYLRTLESKDLTVDIDGKKLKPVDIVKTENSYWIEFEPIKLDVGEKELKISLKVKKSKFSKVIIDEVVLCSLNLTDEKPIHEIFRKPNVKISFKKLTPCTYIVNMQNCRYSRFVVITFSEAYHPLWIANLNGREHHALNAYSTLNCFIISTAGEDNLKISIKFKGQNYLNTGILTSQITFLGIIAYLLTPKRIKNKIKTTIKAGR